MISVSGGGSPIKSIQRGNIKGTASETVSVFISPVNPEKTTIRINRLAGYADSLTFEPGVTENTFEVVTVSGCRVIWEVIEYA